MSAPSTAYLTEVLPISNGTITDALYLAIDLSAYAGNMKALFYVDFFLSADKGSKKGLIGVVEDNSSLFNYKLHNPSRFSKLRLKNPAGTKTYIVMNDGALNTKAFTNAPTSSNKRIGTITVSSNIVNAFYVDTSLIKVQYKNSSAIWINWLSDPSIVTQGTTVTKTFIGQMIDGFYAGDEVSIRFVVTNNEGDHISQELLFIIELGFLEGLKYHQTVASYANAQTNGATLVDSYVDRYPIFDGSTRFFKTDTVPLNVSQSSETGYYIYDGYWYKIEPADEYGVPSPGNYSRVTDFGRAVAGQYPIGDPGNPTTYAEIVFNNYSTIGGTDACAVIGTDFTRYLQASDNKVYINTSFLVLIPDGYYTRRTGGAGYKWFQYASGLVIASGVCLDPE